MVEMESYRIWTIFQYTTVATAILHPNDSHQKTAPVPGTCHQPVALLHPLPWFKPGYTDWNRRSESSVSRPTCAGYHLVLALASGIRTHLPANRAPGRLMATFFECKPLEPGMAMCGETTSLLFMNCRRGPLIKCHLGLLPSAQEVKDAGDDRSRSSATIITSIRLLIGSSTGTVTPSAGRTGG